MGFSRQEYWSGVPSPSPPSPRIDVKLLFSCSVMLLSLCDPMDCSTPGFPVLHHLLELAQTHVHRVGDAIQPSHTLLSPSPAFNLSQHQGLFKWVSSSHQLAKVFSNFNFSISPSYECSGLISFRMDWLDLLAVLETLKSLLQHHSSKASILQHSAFFMVQLSHPYMTTGKTIALTRGTFVGKVMSLLFNFMSAITICSDFGAQENKLCHCFHCFPIYLPWSNGTGCYNLHFLKCWDIKSGKEKNFFLVRRTLQISSLNFHM